MKIGAALLSIIILTTGMIWSQEKVSPGIEGIWMGSFSAGAVDLRIVFHIKKKGDGYSGTMDSPDQGAAGLKLDPVIFEEGMLTAEWPRGQFVYKGKLSEDGLNLIGQFTQGGASFKMDMKKVEKPPNAIRPQTPKKPYPYLEEDVEYRNARDNTKLAATLTLPEEGAPFPAVVLITGSGAQNRDEEILGHKPFLVLADHLTRKGIAVLRADDRGVGGSEGSIESSTTEDFAYDSLAGVEFLKSRSEIDPSRIGLVGHSEGGIIAPLAATLSSDVSYIVLLAGTGLTGEEILYLQAALISAAEGTPKDEIEKNRRDQKKIYSVLKSDKDDETIKKILTDKFHEDIASMSEEEKKAIPDDKEAFLQGQFKQILSPWFRFFLTYDPRPTLKKVRCPVLALIGEKDLQVPPEENLKAMEEALKEGGNPNYAVKMLPGLNHLFQKAGTGSPSEYKSIQETINPSALKAISDWIIEQTGG